MKWEDYESLKKQDGKDIREEFRAQAGKQVLIRLGIEKLYEMEKSQLVMKMLRQKLLTRWGIIQKNMLKK